MVNENSDIVITDNETIAKLLAIVHLSVVSQCGLDISSEQLEKVKKSFHNDLINADSLNSADRAFAKLLQILS